MVRHTSSNDALSTINETSGQSRKSRTSPTKKASKNKISEENKKKNQKQSTKKKEARSIGNNSKKPEKNNTNNLRKKTKSYSTAEIVKKISNQKFSKEREQELGQCLQLLGQNQFKLFKTGNHVTSYGFIPKKNKILGITGVKFIINIPHNYPSSPIKLTSNKSSPTESNQLNQSNHPDRLDILVKNFNIKARQFLNDKIPIVSQINYLMEETEILVDKNFRTMDKMRSDFYSQFV